MGSVKEEILARLSEGVAIADINGSRSNVWKRLDNLCKEGRAFKGLLDHKHCKWFDTKEKADHYASTKKPRYRAQKFVLKKDPKPAFVIHKKVRPGWGPDDPCHITSETKVTIAPPLPDPPHTCTHPVW